MIKKVRDMTKDKPAKLIILFAIPLMLGNIFQQLYNIVDTIVIGKFIGVEALAAIGAGTWLYWMATDIIIGFTQGFSILISQYFGEDNIKKLRKTVTMSILLAVIMSILMTVLSLTLAKPVLILLNTPENIIDISLAYLRIVFAGISVIMAYNTFSAILRALGNSRTPLVAMIIAAFINIVLDLVLVVGLKIGVAGAAIATVIAQLFSGLFCFGFLRKIPLLKLKKDDWKIDKEIIKKLVYLGTPISFQNGIIGFGGLVVQYVINGFGFIFVAGFTATNKLYGILEVAAVSFGYSISTFTGQNLGAKKYDRIRVGMKAALKMAIGTSIIISIIMIVFGRNILSMFISGTPEEVKLVIDIAYRYLTVMSSMLFILYMLHTYRCAIQGMGDTIIPMTSGIIELFMRIGVVLILPIFVGQIGIYFAEVAAWTGAVMILMPTYYIRLRKICCKDQYESA